MAYSLSKYGYRWSSGLWRKVLRRFVLILLIGWGLRAFPFTNFEWAKFRWMGVLPRIAWVYLLASLLVLSVKRKTALLVSTGVLVAYWLVLFYGSGGSTSPFALETNFARKVDLLILGADHLWKGLGIPFDPEGILSTFPAMVTTVYGYLYGRWMREQTINITYVRFSLILGFAGIALAYLWNPYFPINKSLWTGSYVLLSTGLGIILLAGLTYWMDVRGKIRGLYFFEVFGRNALIAFVLSIFLVKVMLYVWRMPEVEGGQTNAYHWLFVRVFQPILGDYPGSLAFALVYMLLIWIVMWRMDKRGIYIKL